jgi:hypothetical protein
MLYTFAVASFVTAYISARLLYDEVFPPYQRPDIDAADSDDVR